MKTSKLILLLFAMTLVLGTLTGCGEEEVAESEEYGNLAQFTAETLDGGSFTQDDIQAKDVTIINFWSTTCGPCIAEMPDLAAYAEGLPENVQLITVCLDGNRKKETAESILQEAGFAGITLTGGDGDFETVMKNIRYTPTTIFVDSEGNLATIQLDPEGHFTGQAIIGGSGDVAADFTSAVNQVLKAAGKAEISIEGE